MRHAFCPAGAICVGVYWSCVALPTHPSDIKPSALINFSNLLSQSHWSLRIINWANKGCPWCQIWFQEHSASRGNRLKHEKSRGTVRIQEVTQWIEFLPQKCILLGRFIRWEKKITIAVVFDSLKDIWHETGISQLFSSFASLEWSIRGFHL